MDPIPDHMIDSIPDHTMDPLPDHTMDPIPDHTMDPIPDHTMDPILDHMTTDLIPDHMIGPISDNMAHTSNHTKVLTPDQNTKVMILGEITETANSLLGGDKQVALISRLTAVVEIEAVINSRPLSHVSAMDVEEPLTPSHLLVRRRILSLPDYLGHICEPSNEDFEVSASQLTKRMKHLASVLNHF